MKIEFTVETIENGYVLRWIDGLVDQFHHAVFFSTEQAIALRIHELLLEKKDESR